MRWLVGVSLTVLTGGCTTLQSINPVDWWHDAQGGKIAEQRPAPPGANDAFPNLSTVPVKPVPPDRDTMKKLTESLVADRTNAQYTAEASPIADPSSPVASPNLFGGGALRPAPAAAPVAAGAAIGVANASLAAASAPAAAPKAPEAPVTPPARAPVRPVTTTPLAAQEAAAPSPALPTQAPPRPVLAGVPGTPVPVPGTPVPGTPPPPIPVPAGTREVVVQFPAGGTTLSPVASEAVKQFATKRGSAGIAVTGYGDAASADPAVQTVALGLGLARAQVIASALTSHGVPASVIRVGSEATGRGASVRLLP